jgi:FAD/FMN-containing dehydrogenase
MNRQGRTVSAARHDDARAALAAVVGAGNVLHEAADTARHLADWSGDRRGAALAVVRPADVAEVRGILAVARTHGLKVIVQGGNTGLVGGAFGNDPDREIVLSLERMDRVLSVDAEDLSARAEAGCTLQTLKDAAAAQGMLMPLSLGAQGSARIGGNVATNAGGVNVLSYGMMRDQILGLDVVLADGTLWSSPRGLRKDNRGIDMRHLFAGSEGALGVVVAVEVKLVPLPERVETAYAATASFADAMRLYRAARRESSGLLTAFEVIGAECLPLARLANPALSAPLSESHPVHAILEISASGAIAARELLEGILARAMAEGVILDAVVAQNGAQARGFWAIREGLVEGQARRGFHIRTDMSVPIGAMASFIGATRAEMSARWPDWTAQVYGHAGDGNVHFNMLPPETMDPAEARCIGLEIANALRAAVLAAGGSFSAEHGIGRVRAGAFWESAPEPQRRTLAALKAALDPEGMLNPGCLIPDNGGPA